MLSEVKFLFFSNRNILKKKECFSYQKSYFSVKFIIKRKQSHLKGESHIKQKVVINVVSSGLLYGIVVLYVTHL